MLYDYLHTCFTTLHILHLNLLNILASFLSFCFTSLPIKYSKTPITCLFHLFKFIHIRLHRPRGLLVLSSYGTNSLTTLRVTALFVLMPSGIENGYQLLCDAHTVLDPHRGTAAFLFFYSVSSFSTFSFYVFFTLTVLILGVHNLKMKADLVFWFPDRTSVCTHPWRLYNLIVLKASLNPTKLKLYWNLIWKSLGFVPICGQSDLNLTFLGKTIQLSQAKSSLYRVVSTASLNQAAFNYPLITTLEDIFNWRNKQGRMSIDERNSHVSS